MESIRSRKIDVSMSLLKQKQRQQNGDSQYMHKDPVWEWEYIANNLDHIFAMSMAKVNQTGDNSD